MVAAGANAQTAPPSSAPAKPAATAKPTKKAPASQPKFVIEPRAMDLLRAMSARLAAAKTMSFTAVVGYEFPSRMGPPLVYTTRYDVTLQRPDKLRILMPGDGTASEFYYDGKSMVAYAPVENLAAVAAAPPTIDEALKAAYRNAAIFFPFTDMLVADPYAALTDGAILAFYIGPSAVVGGVRTEMLAWANKDVFLQIWIGAEDKLPRRVRAVFHADPQHLRHEIEFSNWQLNPKITPGTFTSSKASAAKPMAFNRPDLPSLPAGIKPPADTNAPTQK
jgi:hypothetical protein